jgi:sulfur carrier protein ThiS
MMKIKIILYETLKEYGKDKLSEDNTMLIPEGTTIQGLADILKLPYENGLVFSVNNTLKHKEDILYEDDEVRVFLFIAGG